MLEKFIERADGKNVRIKIARDRETEKARGIENKHREQ